MFALELLYKINAEGDYFDEDYSFSTVASCENGGKVEKQGLAMKKHPECQVLISQLSVFSLGLNF